MDARNRIVHEFNRLNADGYGQPQMPNRSFAERSVYFVVAARCEKDMEGFESIFAQAFTPSELSMIIEGLRAVKEDSLANEFQLVIDMLTQVGYYEHFNWDLISDEMRQEIEEIGDRIGDAMWALDEKLAALLDSESPTNLSQD